MVRRYFLKIACVILLGLMLCSCQRRADNNAIVFIDDYEIEISSDFRFSSLIKSVDGFGREDCTISDDDSTILLPNGSSVAVNTTNKKIELQTLKVVFRYNSRNYTKEIVLQDTTAPNITVEDTYTVAVGNQYFNLENLIKCSDNYTDENNIEIYYNGSYDVEKAGTYTVEIIAYDEKKNKAAKSVKIVVEEDKEEPQQEETSNNSSQYQNSAPQQSSSSSQSQRTEQQPSYQESPGEASKEEIQHIPSFTPEEKTFLIDNYESFDECLYACQSYINSCIKKGYSGIATAEPVKKDGIYIGYRAVFN